MKKTNDRKISGFIHFLQNEFSLGAREAVKIEKKIVKVAKKETLIAKENFYKIGNLIDEALKHLPDANEANSPDLDENNSKLWQKAHAKTANEIKLLVKPIKKHSDILFVGTGSKNGQIPHDWKTLALAIPLTAFVLINSYFSINPESAKNIYTKLIAPQENEITNYKIVIDSAVSEFSTEELEQAKADYIVQNQKTIKGKKTVGVSASDLFGSVADAKTPEIRFEPEAETKTTLEELFDYIVLSWINFFKY